jgi:sigma-B regulation protein RsbU (phosphoserine phosphatase)
MTTRKTSKTKENKESGPLPAGLYYDPERISPFLDNAPVGIIITEGTSKIEYSNLQIEKIFGYNFKELQGKPIETLIPDSLRRKHVKHRKNYQANPHTRPMGIGLDLLGLRKNGEIFPVEIGLSYLKHEDKLYVLCYLTDISERKQMERQLRLQNAFLSALHETSLNILSRLDLKEVLESLIVKATTLLEFKHGQIFLVETGKNELVCKVGTGAYKTQVGSRLLIGQGFIGTILETGQPLVADLAEVQNSCRGMMIPEGVKTIMGVPLQSGNEKIGVVCVAGDDEPNQSSGESGLEMLKYFGQLASIAIQNAQLFSEVERSRQETERHNARMERELQIARTVQVAMLPKKVPEVAGWEFATRWKPALEVAGDYYDFIARKDGTFDLIIADVTDKGVPAALFMAHSKTLLRSSLEISPTLLAGVTHANQLIMQDNIGPFVTVFATRLETKTGNMTYVNAGHDYPLVYRSANDKFSKPDTLGIPLGVDLDWDYQQASITLGSNDFIVLYTDGVTEAMNQDFEQFGDQRLLNTIKQLRRESAENIAQGLIEAVEAYIAQSNPSDDITIVVVKRI